MDIRRQGPLVQAGDLRAFRLAQLNEQKPPARRSGAMAPREGGTDITSPTRTQTWTLDDLGNWSDTTIDSTTETRTHNPACEQSEQTGREPAGRVPKGCDAPGAYNDVNELTQRTVGGNSTDLTYDDAGNLAAAVTPVRQRLFPSCCMP